MISFSKLKPNATSKPARFGPLRRVAEVFMLLAVASGLACGLHFLQRGTGRAGTAPAQGQDQLATLLGRCESELAQIDVADRNLLCAQGLPGSDQIDIPGARQTLDTWANRVRSETERHLYKFRQNPAEYQNSEAYFRILVLVTVLQQDFKIHYSSGQIQSPDFSDSRNLFLHGLLGPERQGTCVSMPVLYVAVGRRLGYPLKLVTTKAHIFARWESPDGKERLNIEATNQGLNCFPDEYYRTWPVTISDDELRTHGFLRSLSPQEELAVFLSVRGHCLEANSRLPEAQVAHAHAHALAPGSPVYLAFLAAALKKEFPEWQRVQVDLGRSPQFPAQNKNSL